MIEGIRQSPKLQLQLVATGTHLSPEFGLTYREIEADGFCIDRKIEMLLSSDTAVGVGKSMGSGSSALPRFWPTFNPICYWFWGIATRSSLRPAPRRLRAFRSPTCTVAKRRKETSTNHSATLSPRCHTCTSSPRRNIAGA